ncbi:ATP-NAD/AcoX kinase [Methylocella silvestris BL2]|uniref:ATP-NAD/AcoX kinase n=1 Tax=Methylocella silvestris (strain DSM 15510 / CIP 108128 / LMG 27833 / NCIMB 13906 / BL2) TaxID=395965 RepID=B8EJB8_METSB|nr:NAD(+)/NADH kinase [Methylocella silvestris]ACK52610.1 ATP-NAD/AcoX kinase [Methylocella silvestris BL2]
MTLTVGIIANPFSARDIRRVVADASGVQIADRANAVLRVLAGLFACGVRHAVMMPDRAGLMQHVLRGIARAGNQGLQRYPEVSPLDMPLFGTVEDTRTAAALMRAGGAGAIVALGGDGTHRAVISACGATPIAAISTGTNNAYAEQCEPTVVGLAVGLAVTGQLPAALAFRANKRLDAVIGGQTHIALVDIALVSDRHVGAKALWRPETFRELYVAFADPTLIGMSAIAGLIEPVSRREAFGLQILFAGEGRAARARLRAPIAPGLIAPIGVADWRRIAPGEAIVPRLEAGSLAFDGEREIAFSHKDKVSITLREGAFRSVDIAACMRAAATHGLLREDTTNEDAGDGPLLMAASASP